VAIDAHAVDLLHVVGEEIGDVLVGRPVSRHAKLIAILLLEALLKVRPVEPVLAEPVQVGELLIGQLIELAVGAGGERLAHEVVQIKHGVGHVLAFAGHPVGEIHGKLQAGMGADQVGVVDIGVVQIALGLHLRLHRLHHLAFAKELVVDLDAGDLFKGLGQVLDSYSCVGMVSESTLISIPWNGFAAFTNHSISLS
jgi:hypothetical protein